MLKLDIIDSPIPNLDSSLGDLCPFLLGFSNFDRRYLSCLSLEVLFVGSEEIHEMNLKYLGHDYPTDVLSFPFTLDFPPLDQVAFCDGALGVGSIVMNIDLAKDMSESLGHSLIDEIKLLFIHAFLHILGFDHEVDGGLHRKNETLAIEHFNLPPGLIARVGG